ncbi:aminodeoxychorismate/anthranilate synthase component II [Oscillospiraceae bacterium MB08-C2-2]|nr:aminodeoxychorismate/anthranilate synthase component II [Oscillospiraceae bacterium MB08-C2-2]
MILLIDNYDSFSYNLVQVTGGLNPDIQVVRNDKTTPQQIREQNPSHIILSPGPGYPADAGICEDVIRELGGEIPILGVCLGHQAICEAFGGEIIRARQLMHGKQSRIRLDTACPLFQGLPEEIMAARYHSLVARADAIPTELEVISTEPGGEVMAVRHRNYNIYGLQFHPESILTPQGETIIRNFLNMEGGTHD